MPFCAELPAREAFIDGLVAVATCSASRLCPICKEEYTKEHPPTLLRPCGHIFGRPCILRWLAEGADTCPLDRATLFTQITVEEDEETVPRVPSNDERNRQEMLVSNSGTREALVRVHPGVTHYLYFAGEVLGVNGRLTAEGCRRVVRDLWYHTGLFSRVRDRPEERDIFSVRVNQLNGCVIDALPRGIHIAQEAWVLLARTARIMLGCYDLALAEGSEASLPMEHVLSWEEDLWVVCGNEDARE